jgi:Domain of unknown function (DUF4041)/T5orf172 domain
MLLAVCIALAVALLLLILVYTRLQDASALATVLEKERAAVTSERELTAAALSDKTRGLEQDLARLTRFQAVADADDAAKRLLTVAGERAAALQSQATAARQEALKAAADIRATAVADANTRAAAIRAESEQLRDTAARAAADLRAAAKAEAETVVAAARTRADKVDSASAERMTEATRRAAVVVQHAEAEAERIAGEALRAVREAGRLEAIAQALQNRIDGYGDRYIVPTQSVLDDLAESLAHTDAGQGFKGARDTVRQMVATGQAALCDYVEPNRKETAIRFVVDAFNGKAETILARVRVDNVGTLLRELDDAFTLVNMNGRAFRNARITDAYLAARKDELKLAAAVQELKLQERDEQRQKREQLREDERARREIDKALKDAMRDQELLQKAMAAAEEQLAKASAEQRAAFEAKLADLQAKLAEAEARNQRALSMAQQTRRGHVYVISNLGSFGDDVYKIGLTRRLEPQDRIRELGDSSVPFEFDVHAMIWSDDAPALERQLHKHFVLSQVNKVNHRKEFFRVPLSQVRAELESLGLQTQWTMAAAAREYRESLALEQRIAGDAIARQAWMDRQRRLEDAVRWDEEMDEVGASAAAATDGE